MHLTYLDSNSWLIELAGQQILLDPWLVDDLVFVNAPWLFRGQKKFNREIPENIDFILLSQGLEDHAHPPTLKRLAHSLPVIGSPGACKVVREIGYQDVVPLEHRETVTRGNLTIKAVPGSPIGPTLTENGYILTDNVTGTALYYEPHGYHSPLLESEPPIDVVITPLLDLKLPLLGPVIKGQASALHACQLLAPQVILPTAAGGDVEFSGLLNKFLRAEGSTAEFEQRLTENNLSTRVLEPIPGMRTEIPLRPRTVSSVT